MCLPDSPPSNRLGTRHTSIITGAPSFPTLPRHYRHHHRHHHKNHRHTHRRSLGDLHVLDLATLAWSQPTTTGAPPPPPRSAHVATAWADRYLLVFGGGSVATCYNDLRLLDTATMAWIPVSLGPGSVSPTPRAGHAAALLGSVWYVVGGGNNVKGCTDMLALELGGLTHAGTAADATGSSGGKGGGVTLSWRNVASIALRDALSSEGMGLVAVPQVHALLAFGGYNGKYQQGVSVFAPGPAAAAAAPSAPGSAAPPAKQPSASAATLTTTTSNGSTAAAAAKANKAALPPPPPPMDVPALLKQLDAAKQSANAAMADAVTLKNQLTAAQGSIQDLEAACEAANSALQAEVANKLRLEAQIAEMRRQVSEAAALEREVERLKRQVAEMEAAASKKAASSSGGLFGYIMGGSSGGGGGSQ